MISLESSGSFKNTERFLMGANVAFKGTVRQILESCGQDGVAALEAATPRDSGLAANSWRYEVLTKKNGYEIVWSNSDIENGYPVAVMIQYGHGTGTGGYVQGQDYINPALRPIFDKIAERAWKAVIS